MGTFVPIARNFLSRTKYRTEGGFIAFELQGGARPEPVRYIETTQLDLSAFAQDDATPTTFTWTARFSDQTSRVLWSATTDSTNVGFTLPKFVLDLGTPRPLTALDLVSNRTDHYFMFWGSGGAVVGASVFRPKVTVTAPATLDFPYPVSALPSILPSVIIRNSVPEASTGTIQWFVSSSTNANDAIPGLEAVKLSGNEMEVRVTQPISFFGTVWVTAINPKGMSAAASFQLRLAANPAIRHPGDIEAPRPRNTPYSLPLSLDGPGTGPVTWRLTTPVEGVSIDPLTGTITAAANTYINADIHVAVQNRLGATASLMFRLHLATTPRIQLPIRLVASVEPAGNFAFQINQVNAGTGPLTYTSTHPAITLTTLPSSAGRGQVAYGPYIREEVVFTATNPVGDSASNSSFVHVAATPVLVPPGTITRSTADQDALVPLSIVTMTPAPIAWSLVPNNLGVTIGSNTGILRIPRDGFYAARSFTVFASNEVGGFDAKPLVLNSAQEPVLAPIPSPLRATMTTSDFTYMVRQVATSTGSLTWSITPSNLPGLTIDRDTGLLRVLQDVPVTMLVTVTATNPFGGPASSNFLLDVTQTPLIQPLGPLTATTSTNPYTYQLEQLTTAPQTITWSLQMSNASQPVPPALSVNSQTGLLSFAANAYINDRVTATVTNARGESTSATFAIHVAQRPDFEDPPPWRASIRSNQVATLPLVELSQGTGGTAWRVRAEGGAPLPNVSISGTGVLSYGTYAPLVRTIEVTATNRRGIETTKSIATTILLTPEIEPFESVVHNFTTNSEFFFDVPYNQIPDVVWTLDPTPSGVSLNPNTGRLTFVRENAIYERATVSVSNVTGGRTSNNFLINVAQTPVLPTPLDVTCNLAPGVPLTLSLQQTAVGTGPLTWSLPYDMTGVTIDKDTGVLTVGADAYVEDMVVVETRTRAGGLDSTAFMLTAGHTPVIEAPEPIEATLVNDDILTFPFVQTTLGTGPLYWSLLTPLPNTTVNAAGILTVSSDTYVKEDVAVVQASNISTGGFCNQTFSIHVAQRPFFQLPPVIKGSTTDADFEYPIVQQAPGAGPVTWSLSEAPPNVSITSAGGVLRALKNNYIDGFVTVSAANDRGTPYNVRTKLLVAQTPQLAPPSFLTCNLRADQAMAFSFPIQQLVSEAITGPLTWAPPVDHSTGLPIPGLTITQDGRLQHTTFAVSNEVRVKVRNPPDGSNVAVIPTVIVQTPVLVPPAAVEESVVGPYSYAMTVANLPACQPLRWAIQREDTPQNLGALSIDEALGIVRLAPYSNIDTHVTVTATNLLGYSCNITFPLHVLQTPAVTRPNAVTLATEPGQEAQFTMEQTAPNTGQLYWTVGDGNLLPDPDLRIDDTGTITVVADKYIERSIRVRASNVLGGVSNTDPFPLTVAVKPSLSPVAPIDENLPSSTPFTYAMQTLSLPTQTGPLAWFVSSHPGLTIDQATGVLTLDASSSINETVTVTVQNRAAAQDTVSFSMKVSQLPFILSPNNTHVGRSRAGDYIIQMVQTVPRANPVTWELFPSLPGLSINQTTGVITLVQNSNVDATVSVVATNQNLGSFTVTFPMQVLQTPFLNFGSLVEISPVTTSTTDFTFDLAPYQVAHGTGSLTWAITDLNNVPLGGGIFIDNAGLLTIPASVTLNSTVRIAVRNDFSQFADMRRTINVRVSPAPSIASADLTILSSNAARVYWTDPQAANTFVILNNTTLLIPVVAESPSTTFVESGLVPNTRYSYTVTPRNIFNDTGAPRTTPERTTLPASVGPLRIDEVGFSNVVVRWDAVPANHARGAQLAWSNIVTPEFPIGHPNPALNVTSCNVQGLLPNYPYTFTVTPYNLDDVAGVPSVSAEVVTLPRITSLTTASITSSNLVLTWQPPPSANFYSNVVVTWVQNAQTFSSNISNTNALPLDNLPQNTLYTFTATPFNIRGIPGTPLTLTTATTALLSPLTVTTSASGALTVSWGAGDYEYVRVTWSLLNGTVEGSQDVYGTFISITLQGTNEDLLFTCEAFNRNGEKGQTRSVRVTKRDDIILWFDSR
jgi:hypothetical protein